jgi:hypothetical protein
MGFIIWRYGIGPDHLPARTALQPERILPARRVLGLSAQRASKPLKTKISSIYAVVGGKHELI